MERNGAGLRKLKQRTSAVRWCRRAIASVYLRLGQLRLSSRTGEVLVVASRKSKRFWIWLGVIVVLVLAGWDSGWRGWSTVLPSTPIESRK